MPIIYPTAVKSARMTVVRDRIDAGGAAGRLEICSADYASVLATLVLGHPGNATGTVADDTLTLAGFPRADLAADASGTAALARIRTSTGTDVVTGLTVGTTPGHDIVLDSVSVTAGQVVTINSATLRHAP